MEARELRIGNLVNSNIPCKVEAIALNGNLLTDGGIGHISEFEPIPLTEEWLVKLGFDKVNHIHGYSFYTLSNSKINKCHIDIYESKTMYMGYSIKHCQYLHQLQNLYFALTGTELCLTTL